MPTCRTYIEAITNIPAGMVSDLGLEEADSITLDHLVQVLGHSQSLGMEGSIARQVLGTSKLGELGLLLGVSGKETVITKKNNK